MSNQDKKRIMDKIVRCLALSKSSNEHEAATALRQAHAMMAKHGISQDDIKLADIKFQPSSTRTARRPPIYLCGLADMIGELFGCKIYLGNGEGKLSNAPVFCFVGLEMHSTIASYAHDSLCRQLKQARLDYMRTELKRVRLAKNKAARADAFCMGWVVTVKRLVSKLVPLTTDMALIEHAMSQELSLRTTNGVDRARKNRAVSGNDYHNGIVAGKSAKLHHAMNGKGENGLIGVDL